MQQSRLSLGISAQIVATLATFCAIICLAFYIISPFFHGYTDKDFDKMFQSNITFTSVYEDSLEHNEGWYIGTRSEIRNLRKYLYHYVSENYGRPRRQNLIQIDEGGYRIMGKSTVLQWEFGKFKKSFSKSHNIEQRMYYVVVKVRNLDDDQDDEE